MYLLYLAGSLIGVALIVGLNIALFGRTKPALGSLADIAARLAADIPGFRAGAGIVAKDTALIEDAASGALFLVKAVGDRLVVRKMSRAALGGVVAEGSALKLRLRDFTFTNATLELADGNALRAWESRLKAIA